MPAMEEFWVAERVPSTTVAQALISLIVARRGVSRRHSLLWLTEDALQNGSRRLILDGRLVRSDDVQHADTVGGCRAYTPSRELGLFLNTPRGMQLYIIPRPDSPGRSVQYNVGVACPVGSKSRAQRYVTIFRRAGVEMKDQIKAPSWLKDAMQIIAPG